MGAPTGTLRRLGLVVSGGLALVGLVGGCSDPDRPSTLPSNTPAPTSSSPSPSLLTVEQEVEAAVRAYYAELTRAAQTSDTTKLRTMMVPSCPCYRAVKVIDKNQRQGEKAPDSTIDLDSVRIRQVEGSTASAEVRFSASAYDVVNAEGAVVDHVDELEAHWDLSVVRTPQGVWVIANLVDLEG